MPELPTGIDTSRPHSARVYDYMIGGKNNFAADRALAEKMLRETPGLRTAARENRAFLGRAVQYLAGEAGVRRFVYTSSCSVYGVGTGVRYKSPLGPIEADIAYGVKPHKFRLHFTLGMTF